MPATEPAGLNMSLDALIQKRGPSGPSGGRGWGRGLGAQGGINKPLGAGGRGQYGQGRGQGYDNSRGQGFDSGRGGFSGRGGGSGRGFVGPGRGSFAGRGSANGGTQHGAVPNAREGNMQVPMMMPEQANMNFMQMQSAMATMQEQARIIAQQQQQVQMLLAQSMQQQQRAAGAGIRGVGALPVQQQQQQQQQQQRGASSRQPQMPASLPEEPEPVEVKCECFVDSDTGNTQVSLEGITIVTVSPSGEVVLSTGGWWTDETIEGMNKALFPIGMKVVAEGDPEEGSWYVFEGANKRFRFEDDMRIPPKGQFSSDRANAVIMAFDRRPTPAAHLRAPAAAAAAAGRLDPAGARAGATDYDYIRRMRAQGRSY